VFGDEIEPTATPKKTVLGSDGQCIKFDSGDGYPFGLKFGTLLKET